MSAPRHNSRLGRPLTDVPAWDHPLVHGALHLVTRLGRGELDVPGYQARVLAHLRAAVPGRSLAARVAQALEEGRDQVLVRRTLGGRDYTLQLLYLQRGEVHPPHCHHNVVSTQVLLAGHGYRREYERVARLDRDTLRLLPVSDGPIGPGAVLQSSERLRNGHWFAALDAPCVMLNFNVRGYERDTLDPPATLGRRLIDPRRADPDGRHVRATSLPVEEAYAVFGARPLAAFPLPVALAGPPAPLHLDLRPAGPG